MSADIYLEYAADCEERARRAPDERSRQVWLEMAQFWSQCREASAVRNAPSPDGTAPVVQQQQQIQPKEDNEQRSDGPAAPPDT
jgi:hypothetical protein